jgi:hypothetical protein
MANMVNAACTAVTAVVAHCFSVGMIALMLRRAVSFAMRRASSG